MAKCFRARVIASSDDELKASEGDIIDVIGEVNDGWYLAVHAFSLLPGIIPKANVQAITDYQEMMLGRNIQTLNPHIVPLSADTVYAVRPVVGRARYEYLGCCDKKEERLMLFPWDLVVLVECRDAQCYVVRRILCDALGPPGLVPIDLIEVDGLRN